MIPLTKSNKEELSDLNSKIESQNREISKLQEEQFHFQEEIQTLNKELQLSKDSMELAKQEKIRLNQQIQLFQERMMASGHKKQNEGEIVKKVQEDQNQLITKLSKSKIEVDDLRSQIKALKNINSKLQSEVEMKENLGAKPSFALNEKNQILSENSLGMKKEVSEDLLYKTELQTNLMSKEMRIFELSQALSELSNKHDKVCRELEAYKSLSEERETELNERKVSIKKVYFFPYFRKFQSESPKESMKIFSEN